MADVQIDNGEFTRIANVLLEQAAKLHLNGTQYSIILTLWRFTYGFRRCEHELSITFISKATGINPRMIRRELKTLIDRHIITVFKESTKADSRVLKFNKNYDTWEQGTKKTSEDKKDPCEGTKKTSQQGTKKTPKKEILKENFKESVPYSEIIDYLNEKTGMKYKPTTKATREHIHARWEEKFKLDDFKLVIDSKAAEWLRDPKMKKYLRPETLFGTKFESYLNTAEMDKPKPKTSVVVVEGDYLE